MNALRLKYNGHPAGSSTGRVWLASKDGKYFGTLKYSALINLWIVTRETCGKFAATYFDSAAAAMKSIEEKNHDRRPHEDACTQNTPGSDRMA